MKSGLSLAVAVHLPNVDDVVSVADDVEGDVLSPDARSAAERRADEVAARLGVPRIDLGASASSSRNPIAELAELAGERDFLLWVGVDQLELQWLSDPRSTHPHRSRPIVLGFDHLAVQRGAAGGSRRQPIARAVGLHKERGLTLCDATAGYGEDSWLLAALGCEVTSVERDPLLGILLEDALQRARAGSNEIAERIRLVQQDALHTLAAKEFRADVVYLDPMFPERRKSALEAKSMRLLRCVVGEDVDAQQLLEVALASDCRRVVVKRPRHASPLVSGVQHDYPGRGLRYDVYLTGRPSQ